jgi:hypothetical protein
MSAKFNFELWLETANNNLELFKIFNDRKSKEMVKSVEKRITKLKKLMATIKHEIEFETDYSRDLSLHNIRSITDDIWTRYWHTYKNFHRAAEEREAVYIETALQENNFLCLISLTIMTNPVYLNLPDVPSKTINYEKSEISEWVRENNTDPITRHAVTMDDYLPNEELKTQITKASKYIDYYNSKREIKAHFTRWYESLGLAAGIRKGKLTKRRKGKKSKKSIKNYIKRRSL